MSGTYKNNQEYFEAVEAFCIELSKSNQKSASECIHEGLSCVNGLTDGWWQFLNSLEKVKVNHSQSFTLEQTTIFDSLVAAAQDAVSL